MGLMKPYSKGYYASITFDYKFTLEWHWFVIQKAENIMQYYLLGMLFSSYCTFSRF